MSEPAKHPFNEDEKNVFDSIVETMKQIETLDPRGKLMSNTDELVKAVHVLQQFPIQHMLHRLWPSEFANWYTQTLASQMTYGDKDA